MSFLFRTFLLVCILLLLSTFVAAQGTADAVVTAGSGVQMGSGASCGTTMGPIFAVAASGPSAPYSGVREDSTQQTLADGTHISQTNSREKIYRDSENRTRTERPICRGFGQLNREATEDLEAIIVEIHDPVSGYAYILDVQGRVAHRYVLKAREMASSLTPRAEMVQITRSGSGSEVLPPPPPREMPAPPDNRKVMRNGEESLGTETMEGLLVEGARTTTTIPVGKVGNDRPLAIVRENWVSPVLKMAILTKLIDPRFGERVTRLTNVDTSEPSPLLFQPPPGYKVVDETEAVDITYQRP
jgi:hypothetical protein